MITVFGLGFVGLTTALGFAHYGYKVYGVDVDGGRKQMIRDGKLPFLEKELDEVLVNNLNKTFFVEDDVEKAVKDSEIIFYCVGTPYGQNGEANLSYLLQAIDETLQNVSKNEKKILVIKSTVPPSTTSDKVVPYIEQKGFIHGKDVLVANNPEFLREGYCWEDFIHADRIIIGSHEGEEIEKLNEIYEPFHIPIHTVSWNTGEFIKYLSNTLLATMISYSNEMAEMADLIGGIDVANAFHILHMDKRWSSGSMASYVYPGCGYGGYCLPKDTNAFYALAKARGGKPEILGNVIRTNDEMPQLIARRIERKVETTQKIGILGLSFKPGSDDVRDCASAKVIEKLQAMGFHNMVAYDPVANEVFHSCYHMEIEYADTLQQIMEEADVLVILTAWKEFKDVHKITDKMVLDYRYMN